MVGSLMELPRNILEEIVSKLPIQTILACRCVCKPLLDLTSNLNPHFAALYSPNATQNLIIQFRDGVERFDSVNLFDSQIDINPGFSEKRLRLSPLFELPDWATELETPFLVNACNSLIYFYSRIGERCSLVCNPITKEYVRVPPHVIDHKRMSPTSSVWLGFSPISRVYKVLRFYYTLFPEKVGAHIHHVGSSSSSSSSSTWRDVKSRPLDHISWGDSYVFKDGIGYWICQYDTVFDRRPANFIVFFDFESEIFGKIDAPPSLDLENTYFMGIGVVGDCVCLIDNTQSVDIWMMEMKCGGQWLKRFSNINPVENSLHGSWFKPLQLLSSGEEILMVSYNRDLVLYDMKSNSLRWIDMGGSDFDFDVVTFVPSFMSLQDILKS